MRNAFLISIIALAAFCFCGIASAQDGAVMFFVKGEVKIQHAGEEFWSVAQKDMELRSSDKIKTGAGGEAEVSLDGSDKNIIKLHPNTEVTMEDVKNKKLFMQKGKVFALIEALPQDSSFEVRTPTAVAGVAGSGMSVGTDGNSTNVATFEHKAWVRGINQDGTPMLEVVIIEEGFERVVGRFEVPGEFFAIGAFDRDQWEQFRENLREHLDTLRDLRSQGSRGAALMLDEIQNIEDQFNAQENNKENLFEEGEHRRRDETIPEPSHEEEDPYPPYGLD